MFVPEPILAMIVAILIVAAWFVAIVARQAARDSTDLFREAIGEMEAQSEERVADVRFEFTTELNQTRERVKFLESKLRDIRFAATEAAIDGEIEIEVGDRVRLGKGNCVYNVLQLSANRTNAQIQHFDGRQWWKKTKSLVKVS